MISKETAEFNFKKLFCIEKIAIARSGLKNWQEK